MRGRFDLLVAAVALAVLVVLSVRVSTGEPAIDAKAMAAFASRRPDVLHDASVVLTVVSPAVDVLVLLAYAITRSYRRLDRRPVLVAAAATLALAVTVLGLKHGIGRAAPLSPVVRLAFPSGHTASVLVCAGTLVLLARPRSWTGWALVVALTVLEAWALLVRSAHWLTDILGAVALGVLLLVGIARLAAALPARARSRVPTA